MLAREVPSDRLTTTNADGSRVIVFPAEVKGGRWKPRRIVVQWALIALYLTIPWLRIGDHPVLLFDVANRRFSVLGQLFFAHEVPTLVFLSLAFFLFIGLVTTVLGRAWCGWACPQTVFIDQVFRKIETLIEGDHLKQRRLHAAPWSADKILKRALKWTAFTLVTLVLTHSFLAYYVGSDHVLAMMTSSPAQNPGAFTAMAILSGIVLFDFGWFREQFCTLVCPYGRLQSVMMDESSKIVAYDPSRAPDCVDCGKCASVCPAGIDIRKGLQIECIACTACIDACDPVMRKVGRPEGLIRYSSLTELAGEKPKRRARPWVYGGLLALCLGGLSWRVATRQPFMIEIVRGVGSVYQTVRENGRDTVINQFNLRFHNMDWRPAEVTFALEPESARAGFELVAVSRSLQSDSGEHASGSFFLKFPLDSAMPRTARLRFTHAASGQQRVEEVNALGPRIDF